MWHMGTESNLGVLAVCENNDPMRSRTEPSTGPITMQPANKRAWLLLLAACSASLSPTLPQDPACYPEGLEVAGLQQVSKVQNLSYWPFFLLGGRCVKKK